MLLKRRKNEMSNYVCYNIGNREGMKKEEQKEECGLTRGGEGKI
jgi:hypothetical protein